MFWVAALAALGSIEAVAAQAPDQIHVGVAGTYVDAEQQPMDVSQLAVQWSVPQPYPPTASPQVVYSVEGGAEQVAAATLVGSPRDTSPATTTDEVEALPVYAGLLTAPLGANITYRVGVAFAMSEPRTFRNLPPPVEPITIVAGTHWGYTGWDRLGARDPNGVAPQEDTMRRMLTLDPDLLLLVGNLGLSTSNKPWNAFMRATEPIQSTVITAPVPGETDTDQNAYELRERYVMPHIRPTRAGVAGLSNSQIEASPEELTYYGFSAGPVYVIGLDSTSLCTNAPPAPAGPTPSVAVPPCTSGTPNAEQIAWLHDTLEDLREDYLVPWIVVFVNHGPYSFADDGDDLAVSALWKPLFDTYNVDLVLHSNELRYQRTFPVRYDAVQNRSLGPYAAGQGPVYVMLGAADGASVEAIPAAAPSWLAVGGKLHGFVSLEATNETLHVSAVETENGTVIDSFTLDKTLAAQPVVAAGPAKRMPAPGSALLLGGLLVSLLLSRRGGSP